MTAETPTIALEIGYSLIPLADPASGAPVIGTIEAVRRQLSHDFGFGVPGVRIRDNLELAPGSYRVSLLGAPVAEAEAHPDWMLAVRAGPVRGELDGIATHDPASGVDATWIDPRLRERALALGYTVVDPATVIARHMSHVLQTHVDELLGHKEVQQLLDRLSGEDPALAERLVATTPLGLITGVMRCLLAMYVQIHDISAVAGSLIEHAHESQDPWYLAHAVVAARDAKIIGLVRAGS